MTKPTHPRSVSHGSFRIERVYENATPARVFAAFATLDVKNRWFHGPDGWEHESKMDFRVGGHEVRASGPKGGTKHRFASTFYDIVENERIVWTYDMRMDGRRISVSVATVEIAGTPGGTKLVMTEQGAFLDGLDTNDQRREGTEQFLDNLAAFLAG